jgi:ATPase family associated with various cellular activities (AAA)
MSTTVVPQKKKIVVDGDVLIEWRLARSRAWHRSGALLDPGYYTHCYSEPIGSPLLGELLNAALPCGVSYDVLRPKADTLMHAPSTGPYWHHYLLCKQMPRERERKDRESDKTLVWRVEQKLGIDRPTHEPNALQQLVNDEYGDADLLLIEHSHKGFADCPSAWPKSLTKPVKLDGEEKPWLVLRWIRPEFYATQFRSELWKTVVKNFSGRIVIVVTADDLRLMGMQISRSLSWERTIDDLDRGMRLIWPGIRACAHVVVSFATAGAAVFSSTDGGGVTSHLCYDPLFMHEEWMRDYPGSVVGYTRGLTVAVALDLLTSTNRQHISPKTLRAGPVAARLLQMDGLVPVGGSQQERDEAALPAELRFPIPEMAKAIRTVLDRPDREDLAPESQEAKLRNRKIPSGLHYWRIVDDELGSQPKILAEAVGIVENGYEDHQWNFPIASFGKLIAIDRTEIESLSSICALMLNYVTATAKEAPLSIAVFGEPGTGKSFAIRAVADQLSARQALSPLAFNLSQFTSPDGIINALHQVRDMGLSGVVPLVFWDEFDSNFGQTQLGWLRYFLAPMQDGVFQEGPATHNIGRAIFVFAGGAHTNMSQFQQTVAQVDKALKGPDFLSRLKGFVNIVGLNYTDPHRLEAAVTLRRAIMLRSFLVGSAGNLMQRVTEKDGKVREKANVDPGVVEAFLRIGRYRYASRSMEAIVKMSAISGKAMYERSSLPPVDQMNLHVDAQAFLELVEQSQSRSDVPAGVP